MAKAAKNNYAEAKIALANNLDQNSEPSLKEGAQPWDTMVALLQKAGVVIKNPRRMLAKGDAQTEMPTLQSLPKSTIINPDFNLVSLDNLPMRDILVQVGSMDYRQQSQQLHANTFKYVLPESAADPQEVLQELSRQAEHGNTQAMFKLALLYENGDGVTQDRGKAFSWFMKAAELHHLRSEYMIGVCYLNGWGVDKNIHLAIWWLRTAALNGEANAQLLLGGIYEYGLDEIGTRRAIRKDISRARAMYSLAAQNGLPVAQYRLAQMYTSGLFNPTHNHEIQSKEFKIAHQLYVKAAKAGMEQAKVYLAYFDIANNVPDSAQADNAYEIAKKFSRKDDHKAELLLAILYGRGIEVRKNPRSALAIYRSLAEENNALANFMLGTYYYLYDLHDVRARDYLTRAAQQGIVYAQYNLAIIAKNDRRDNDFMTLLNEAIAAGFDKANLSLADYYLVNQGDRFAMKDAVAIYQKLAKKQDPGAELKLGYMYQNGIYFSRDNTQALYWYKKAADHGNKIAQYQLGEIYLLGQGVKRNVNLALKYYQQSAAQQFAPAMAAVGYIKAVDQFDYKAAKEWYKKARRLDSTVTKVNFY